MQFKDYRRLLGVDKAGPIGELARVPHTPWRFADAHLLPALGIPGVRG